MNPTSHIAIFKTKRRCGIKMWSTTQRCLPTTRQTWEGLICCMFLLFLCIPFQNSIPKQPLQLCKTIPRDQLRKSRHRHMKSKRWQTGAVFCLMLDWSVINTCIIVKEDNPTVANCDAKQLFLEQLMQSLNALSAVPRGPCQLGQRKILMELEQRRKNWSLGHWPMHSNKRNHCFLHRSNAYRFNRNQTNYYCSQCKVHLHTDTCFKLFHTLRNLDQFN